jgi:hypothetical protein
MEEATLQRSLLFPPSILPPKIGVEYNHILRQISRRREYSVCKVCRSL